MIPQLNLLLKDHHNFLQLITKSRNYLNIKLLIKTIISDQFKQGEFIIISYFFKNINIL